MSQLIPKLLESVSKGDKDKSLELAAQISRLLRSEDPESQWQAYDKIACSLVKENVLWASGYKIETLVGNLFFFSKFGIEPLERIRESSSSVMFVNSYENKVESMKYLVEEVKMSKEYLLENPTILQLSKLRIKNRWEYYLGKASGRDSPELRPGQKKKLFSIKDEKYIMFLKESGLDANLSEYKTFSGQDGKRAEKEVVGPQKLILGVKNATASGNKDEAIRLAREIDLRMIGKGDYSQIRMQVRDSFLKEVFGISGYFNSGCQTMVENFFFLKEMGAPEPLSIIAKNPGCLNLPLSKKWGILNYEVMELKFPIKSIWESPYKLNFQLERVLPRHMYYVKKGKPSLFGCTNAAPLGITKMDQKGDENFIDYLSKAGMNVNLEEYLIFKDGPAVKAKLEIYLNAKGPLDETKQKIKQYLQRLEDQKSNFPLKRE